MKKLFTLFIYVFICTFFAAPVLAQENKEAQKRPKTKTAPAHHHESHHDHNKGHKMKAGLKSATKQEAIVKVEGMVCAFCAQGIVKNFAKRKEVKQSEVDLDKMEVKIQFNEGVSLNESDIASVIRGAGFEYKGLKNAQ